MRQVSCLVKEVVPRGPPLNYAHEIATLQYKEDSFITGCGVLCYSDRAGYECYTDGYLKGTGQSKLNVLQKYRPVLGDLIGQRDAPGLISPTCLSQGRAATGSEVRLPSLSLANARGLLKADSPYSSRDNLRVTRTRSLPDEELDDHLLSILNLPTAICMGNNIFQ